MEQELPIVLTSKKMRKQVDSLTVFTVQGLVNNNVVSDGDILFYTAKKWLLDGIFTLGEQLEADKNFINTTDHPCMLNSTQYITEV